MENTCGIFLIDENEKILVCHITGRPMCGNNWSIPKGLTDEGETEMEAAVRELKEETGLVVSIYGLTPLTPLVYKSGKKTLHPFIFKLGKSGHTLKITCDSYFESKNGTMLPEVDAFKWASLDEAANLLHESQVKVLPEVRRHVMQK